MVIVSPLPFIIELYIDLSRGDDMESFFYLLAYMLTGTLPWVPRYIL